MGVVQAGEGCDDAKVLTPAMDAATKQCPDKAIRHPSILGVNGCEWNKPEEASVSARRKGKTWKQKRAKKLWLLVLSGCSAENPEDVLACPEHFDIIFRRSC